MSAAITKQEVVRQLDILYFNADPAAKQHANTYLMQFQESLSAWQISHELLGDSSAEVQFMGAQTLYLKVKRHWSSLPNQGAFAAQLFEYLRDTSGRLQSHTCLKLALCVSAVAVRTMINVWPSALEDVIQFSSSTPKGQFYATQILISVPEELQDLQELSHKKSSPMGQSLLAKVPLLVTYLLDCIDRSGGDGGGLCELVLQCLLQWAKALDVRFCENEALCQRLVQLLTSEALAESLLEVIIECLQNSTMASSAWKVKNWETEASAKMILANGSEGMVLRALLEQIQALHPKVEQLCNASEVGLDGLAEKHVCLWARVVVMFGESYTQLLFEKDCEFILHFLGCCFRLSPSTAQPLFEFWSQIKEMQREELLTKTQLQTLLLRLTDPCISSLLRYIRRDSTFSEGAPEDLSVLRDMAKDVACDVFCLWQAVDQSQSDEFVRFLSQRLMQALSDRDALNAETCLVLLEGIVDVLESPLPAPFLQALQAIPTIPDDEGAMAAAAVLLHRCSPHVNAHADILPGAMQFLMRALPAAPHTVSDAMLELTGYAGHHLTAAAPSFLAEIERVAPNYAVKVDNSLYAAVVCTMRRLPAAEEAPAFVSLLQLTMNQLQEAERQIQESPGCVFSVPEPVLPHLFRLLSRVRTCIWTLEQTPDEPDGPPPTRGKGSVAACVLAVLGPNWASFSRVLEAVFVLAPSEFSVVTSRRADVSELREYSEAALAFVCIKILRSCIMASKSSELSEADAGRFVVLLLQLLVGVVRHNPGHCHALSPLAELLPVAHQHRLLGEFGSAFQVVCDITTQRLASCSESVLPELAPLFEFLLACAGHLAEVLYGYASFNRLEQLALAALGCAERDLNKALLQFLLAFASSSSPVAQQHFANFVQALIAGVLQNFHRWPQSTRRWSSDLFTMLLERYGEAFHGVLLRVWQEPGTTGVHQSLDSAQKEACARHFKSLRGMQLKAFLGDLMAIANGMQTTDVLGAYA